MATTPAQSKASQEKAPVFAAIDPLNRAAERVASIDAYRGLVMFLMMAEVLHLAKVSAGLS